MRSRTTPQTVEELVRQIRARRAVAGSAAPVSTDLTTLGEAALRETSTPRWFCGPTGLPEFDRLWPEAVLAGGRLVEWCADHGGGGGTFGLLSAAQTLQARPEGKLVVIEPPRIAAGSRRSSAGHGGSSASFFYALAAPAWGVDLARVVVIRPVTWEEAFWGWEQALRCPGTAAVYGVFGDAPPLVFRRLHRAAEVGGSVGLLLRSDSRRGGSGWADVAWRVETMPGCEDGSEVSDGPQRPAPLFDTASYRRRFQVELLRCRGRLSGGVAHVELTHEATAVPVVSAVASPAPAARRSLALPAAGRAV